MTGHQMAAIGLYGGGLWALIFGAAAAATGRLALTVTLLTASATALFCGLALSIRGEE